MRPSSRSWLKTASVGFVPILRRPQVWAEVFSNGSSKSLLEVHAKLINMLNWSHHRLFVILIDIPRFDQCRKVFLITHVSGLSPCRDLCREFVGIIDNGDGDRGIVLISFIVKCDFCRFRCDLLKGWHTIPLLQCCQ